jgi:Tol biopolymer transport system component
MQKLIIKSFIICLSIFSLTGCAVSINYLANSPEESGSQFVQITQIQDNCVGPLVANYKFGFLNWWKARYMDISPDGKTIAFTALKEQKLFICLKSLEGGNSVTQRTYGSDSYEVAFSSSGKNIAFGRVQENNVNICAMNTFDGTAIKQITSTGTRESNPSYSWDGKMIFFTKTEIVNFATNESESFIWGYDIEKGTLTQYTKGTNACAAPDGEHIFISRTRKNPNGLKKEEIWMVNLSTGQESTILSDQKKSFSNPQISPDGTRLVVEGETPATGNLPRNLDIYTVNVDGTNLSQQTFHKGIDCCPRWAPTGEHIYFISQRGNEKGLYNVWKIKYKV